MAYPQVVGTPVTTAQSNSTSSRNITLPSGIAAGDLLLLFLVVGTSSAVTFTPPSGFSAVAGAGTSSTTCNADAFYKIADGTESGTVISVLSAPTNISVASAYRVQGADPAYAPEGVATTGTGTAPNPPSLTPSWGSAETLWFATFGKRTGILSSLSAYPADYTSNQTTRDESTVMIGVATDEVATGTENPGSYTLTSSADWMASTIAVRPLSVGSMLMMF